MPSSPLRVHLLDLTANTIPYDVRLLEAVRGAGADARLLASGVPSYVDLPEETLASFRAGLVDGAVVRMGPSRLRRPLKAIEYLWNRRAVARLIREERPAVVHVQWFPFVRALPSTELRWIDRLASLGPRVVYTVHNILPHENGDRYRDIYRRVYSRVDGLVSHTEVARDQLVEEFGVEPDRVRVIRHGPLALLPEAEGRGEARRALGIGEGVPLALLFGNVRPYKGTEFLLGAWRHVAAAHPEARLVIAGRGAPGYVSELEGLIDAYGIRESVEGRFEFIPDAELGRLIAAADVLLYPYRDITQSGALLTALAAGKTVVATDVGGFSETVEHGRTGLLVPYGDEGALASEIGRALSDVTLRETLEAGAAALMAGEYGWDHIGERTVDFYRDLITSPPSSVRSA